MKAVLYKKYGPPEVLHLEDVQKPVPGDEEVLIRVHATTVTAADYRTRGSIVSPGLWLPARLALGLTGPRKNILGVELAGEVEAVGRDVTLFKKGDRVFGTDASSYGAYAEYTCRPEKSALAVMPAGVRFEEAVAVPFGALAALFFLRDKGNIQKGQRVLINGASGNVGSAAVQLARHFGAEITGVCGPKNVDMVRSLGAHQVIDYTRTDFTKSGGTWDIIFDTVGKTSFFQVRNALTPKGRYILTNFGIPQLFQMLLTSMIGGRKVICTVAPDRKEDLDFVGRLLEEGAFKPVIDRRYTLEQIVEAHRYAQAGHKRGSVVITV